MRNRRLPLSCSLTFSAVFTIAAALMAQPVFAQGLQPEPLPIPPTPTAVVNGWIAAGNQAAMRDHAWALWAAANSPSKSPPWPIWQTWNTDTEVSNGPPPPGPALLSAVRRAGRPENVFHAPRQFVHAQGPQRRFLSPLAATVAPKEQVVGFNKFDPTYAGHIWSNQYQNPNTLWAIQNGWPAATPVANRHVVPFPATAIGLKPVFEVARGPNNNGGITIMNYWLGDLTTGPQNSTNPQAPTSNTWKQCVVVNTGSGPVPSGLTCPNGGNPGGTVTLNDFYNFQLDAAEAASICQAQPRVQCPVRAGDFAILVAMHFTTRENDNWTWQTFWWNYNQPFPYGAPPSTIPAPYNHYAMCTAYSMTVNPPNDPKGTNTLCYNPYLEPAVPDGVHSNCMSCHTTASYGSNQNNPFYPPSYAPTAYIANTVPADVVTYFGCQTTTDTSWFLGGNVGNNPSTPPACTP
ncbi:MAG: hypothetical protein WDO17_01680 [Alphaproteobacteria bacterium]